MFIEKLWKRGVCGVRVEERNVKRTEYQHKRISNYEISDTCRMYICVSKLKFSQFTDVIGKNSVKKWAPGKNMHLPDRVESRRFKIQESEY